MKKIILPLGLFLLTTLCIVSCKKDSSTSTGSKSSVSLLTGSRWTFTKIEYENNGVWTTDPADFSQITIAFNTNNTTSEFSPVTGTTAGTWNFSSNNTVITTSGGYHLSPGVYTVNQLTSSTLVITNPNYVTSPLVGQRVTFTH